MLRVKGYVITVGRDPAGSLHPQIENNQWSPLVCLTAWAAVKC